MDSKQIQDLIASKQQEIEMLKNDLAVQELLRGIHFDKLENNVLKDVRMTEYDIRSAATPEIDRGGKITFLLNNTPVELTFQYSTSRRMKGDVVKEELSNSLVNQLVKIIVSQPLDYKAYEQH